MEKHVFHVSGMHCRACPLLVETELGELPQVAAVTASLRHHHVEVTGDFGAVPPADIMWVLEPCLKKHGYGLSIEKPRHSVRWREFLFAVPAAAAFLGLFALLQKTGLIDIGNVGKVNYATAFLIGLVASVSTCMAMVGGLTLSVTANFAKEGDKTVPQLLFHAGRLAAFFLLGGAVGALGANVEPGPAGTAALNVIVGFIMLVLGVNLLDVLPFMKRLQPALPSFISRHLLEISRVNHALTPALLGAATFFLPCGFTQSMQFYALSTGHFLTGALIMLAFALGTLPVLGLLSFAALGIHSRKASGIFFKASGLVVIAFALFNIKNALAVAGILYP
jgi:sulfite exporter TauE/SafE/copper chaperone CopZ